MTNRVSKLRTHGQHQGIPLHGGGAALAGWVNRHQQAIIDYLMEENRVFKQQLQGRRLQLSDNDRRRLAAKAKALGRPVLDEVAKLVTPDTLLAWYRNLVGSRAGAVAH